MFPVLFYGGGHVVITASSVSGSACEGCKHLRNSVVADAGTGRRTSSAVFQLAVIGTFMSSLPQCVWYKCKSSRKVSAFHVRRRGDVSVVHRRLFVYDYLDQELFASTFKFGDLVRCAGAPLLPIAPSTSLCTPSLDNIAVPVLFFVELFTIYPNMSGKR